MLTQKQFDFVSGCVLGDGHIRVDLKAAQYRHQESSDYTHYKCYLLVMSHSEKQKSYLCWKTSVVNSILSRKGSVRKCKWVTAGKEYVGFQVGIGSNDLKEIREGLYPSGKKIFTTSFLKKLTLQALAIFWMDDGCISFSYKKGARDQRLIKDRSAMLSVCSDEQQACVVGNWIKSLTGANYKLVPHKKSGTFYLRWTSDDMRKLIYAIEPFVFPLEDMRYKINLKYGKARPICFSASPNGQQLVNDWERLMDDKTPRVPSTLAS